MTEKKVRAYLQAVVDRDAWTDEAVSRVAWQIHLLAEGADPRPLLTAIGAGQLRGDELRTIIFRLPRIAQVLAGYEGTSIGGLRWMARNGAMTADRILGAMVRADVVGPDTTKGALWEVRCHWQRLVEAVYDALAVFALQHPAIIRLWKGRNPCR